MRCLGFYWVFCMHSASGCKINMETGKWLIEDIFLIFLNVFFWTLTELLMVTLILQLVSSYDEWMSSLAVCRCDRVVTLWRESLATKNLKAAQSLANPSDYENLFPGLQDALKTEQFLTAQRQRVLPASSFPTIVVQCLCFKAVSGVQEPIITWP